MDAPLSSSAYRSLADFRTHTMKLTIHNYIVKNREGRGVAINYIANARTDSDAVHQMIRQTLRVE